MVSGLVSGTSPLRTTTVWLSAICARAARTAEAVPSPSVWSAASALSGRCSATPSPGRVMHTTRSAPASWAASMTHSTMGTPQTGCMTLASDERIRVPWPAAMMSAVSCAAIRLRRVAGGAVGAAVGCGGPRRAGSPPRPRPAWRAQRSAAASDVVRAAVGCGRVGGRARRSLILRGASLGGRPVGRTPGFGPGNGGSSPSPPASGGQRHLVVPFEDGLHELDLRDREDLKKAAALAYERLELFERGGSLDLLRAEVV